MSIPVPNICVVRTSQRWTLDRICAGTGVTSWQKK